MFFLLPTIFIGVSRHIKPVLTILTRKLC